MKVTIKRVAEYTGLSTATISRYINQNGYVSDETGKRIEKVFKELDFKPKPGSGKKRFKTDGIIGVVIPEYNTFFMEVLKGIETEASVHGFQVVVCCSDNKADREIKNFHFLEQIASGIIVAPVGRTDSYLAETINKLDRNGLPIVMVDGEIEGGQTDGVFVDGLYGAYEGVTALIEAGHKKIGFLAGTMTSKTGIERFNGYEKALKQAGIEIRENLIMYAEFDREKAYKLMKRKLSEGCKMTAVFSSNYLMAFGCIKALEENKMSVPQNMSLVTFDDEPAFSVGQYQISAVVNPGRDVGKEAALRLCDRFLAGKRRNTFRTQCRIQLRPQLILRGSEIKY